MTRFHLLGAASALLIGAGFGVPAIAQAAPVSLKGDAKVVRQVAENGTMRETLEEPTKVLPGDRLVFTTRYANEGDKAVTDFVVTNPLPAPVKLSKTGDFQVSVDGGKTFGALAALTVTDAAGKPRAAALADVTHVRWTLATIAPGKAGDLKYFAEVR